MQSNAVLVTAIVALLGFLINGAVMSLVLSRGRKKYHYLFAGVLLAHAIWDIGIFLVMIRNSFINEVIIYGHVASIGATFVTPLVYHFTCAYLNQPRKKLTIFIWAYCVIACIIVLARIGGEMGVFYYSWGNSFRFDSTWWLLLCSVWLILSYIYIWSSCWFLFRARQRETSPLTRRHMLYIIVSFLVVSLALEKCAVVLINVDNCFLMPTGMVLTDTFGALVGIAIVKHLLLDITVIVKKTTIYSILLALIIFIFSLSEHMLATYVGDIFGEHSIFIHIISIAVVIAVLMPIRHKIERAIEGFFARKQLEF